MQNLKNLLTLPALALALAACSGDVDNPLAHGPVALNVEAEIGSVATRVTAQNAFQAGDAIGILPLKGGMVETTQANVQYGFAADPSSSSALKLGPADEPYYFRDQTAVTFNAYYPYKATFDESQNAPYAIAIDTRAENQEKANSDAANTWRMNDYLFASATTHVGQPTVRFTGADGAFRHVMTQVQLKFVAGSGVADLSGTNGLTGYTLSTPLALQGTFSPATGQTVTDDASRAQLKMNLDISPENVGDKVTEYAPTSLILLPQTVEGGRLVVDATFNGQTYRASLTVPAPAADASAAPALLAGYAYTYTVTVKNTGLEVSEAVIDAWKTDGNDADREGDAELYVEPQVGDYYYADGTYSSTYNANKSVVGLVFHVGHHEGDRSDYSTTGIGQAKCNGYVVALKDASADEQYWTTNEAFWGTYVGTEAAADREAAQKTWSGYDNTEQIKAFAEKNGSAGLSAFPPAQACVSYGTDGNYSAPAKSSGWFLPASGQLWEIYNQQAVLQERLTALQTALGDNQVKWIGGRYNHSSTEKEDNGPGGQSSYGRAWQLNLGSGAWLDYYEKVQTDFPTGPAYVRAVLAF